MITQNILTTYLVWKQTLSVPWQRFLIKLWALAANSPVLATVTQPLTPLVWHKTFKYLS